MKKRLHFIILGMILPLVLVGCTSSNTTSNEKIVRVYTARPTGADLIINSTFESKTGIKVEQIEIKDNELMNVLTQESDKTKADLVIFNGAERLAELKSKKLIQAHNTEKTVGELMSPTLYGADWVALTQRPRAFVMLKDSKEVIESYNDITNEKFQSNIFVEAAKSKENVGLMSALYAKDAVAAESFISGIEKNVTLKSEESDINQVKALVKKGDLKGVALVDITLIERLKQSKSDEEKAIVDKIKVVYPKETFANISVMTMSAHAKQKDNAALYMKYLLSREVQTEYMLRQGEYPVRNDAEMLETLATFPPLTKMEVNYEKLGENKEKVEELFNKHNWA